jgi:peptidoglycan/xylan/chitin deacetylase (PgdA/CDA1 family)
MYASDGIYDCSAPGDVALTFDDGPFVYTSHILDLLAQYKAKATFFITGNNNGKLLRKIRMTIPNRSVIGKGAIDNNSLPWPALIR